MRDDKFNECMENIKNAVDSYLRVKVNSKSFKGTIHIELDCFNGSIGRTSILVQQNIFKKIVGNSKNLNYTK